MDALSAPGFLIAVPQLQDPNFKQSVVLLLACNAEGALGVVINRETRLRVADLCRDHDIAFAGTTDKRVRLGGPVQPQQGLVLYGVEHADDEGQRVCDGLFLSASQGTLRRLCDVRGGRFQCFSGYAGWGPGQLEHEIEEGSWVVAPADARSVLDVRPERAWGEVLRSQGIEPGALVCGGAFQA